MSGSAKWPFNFTEDDSMAYPPGSPSTEHDESGSGISTTIPVTFSLPLNFTEDNSPTNSPGLSPAEHDKIDYRISTVALVAMGILVFCAFLFLNFPSLYMCFRCSRQNQDQNQAQDQHAPAPPPADTMNKEQRKAMRYAQIESWLISRRIEPHDEICKKVLIYLDSCTGIPKELKHRTWYADTICTDVECALISADEEKECPVCMDAFDVGDLISWSPNTNCEHVFHHCCIKEWLIERKCCPCCRQTFLPVDQLEGLTKSKKIGELLLGQQQRAANRFFCIRHGVVTLSKPDLCFTKKCEREQMFNKVNSVPSRTELAEIRGCRIENIDSSCEQDVCIPVALDLPEDDANHTTMTSNSIDEDLAEPPTSESTEDLPAVETLIVSTDEEQPS